MGVLACRKSLLLDVFLLYHSALPAIAATDSSVCRTALLGFAIPFNNVAAIHAGDNQRDQDKGLDSPSPCPLGFLPRGSLFPYPYPHPVGVLAELVKPPEHCISCKCGTLNATRPHISTYILG